MHVITPHYKVVIQPDELEQAKAEGYKEIFTLMPGGKIRKHHILQGNNRYIVREVSSIPGWTPPPPPESEKIVQEFKVLPAGPIPVSFLHQTVAFFKAVMTKFNNRPLEAMIHILYNDAQGYHIGIPPQSVSGGSVTYDWSYIPRGSYVVVDIH